MCLSVLTKQQFSFVEYNGVSYPQGYFAAVHEVAGHFDKNEIEALDMYSLHTEYSYGKRKFDTELISNFPVLQESNKEAVPQLWKSLSWANAFADFIIALTANRNPPQIIEIHPPFNDYCTMDEFAERFRIFEEKIHSVYPNTPIVIENRAGTVYHGGKFLIGKAKEIVALCETIKEHNLNLGIVLDFPQLLTAENIDSIKFKAEKYIAAIDLISQHRDLICGIHIWGKKKSSTGRWVAHCGTLDTYFGNNKEVKDIFIAGIQQICNDNKQRFLVPEVNSGAADLAAIMNDLFEE